MSWAYFAAAEKGNEFDNQVPQNERKPWEWPQRPKSFIYTLCPTTTYKFVLAPVGWIVLISLRKMSFSQWQLQVDASPSSHVRLSQCLTDRLLAVVNSLKILATVFFCSFCVSSFVCRPKLREFRQFWKPNVIWALPQIRETTASNY